MVSILSHIVEFRNGESGLHVLHIGTMTELLLNRLREKTNVYHLDTAQISMISKAAAFHDIGKISISEEILNKPGRLTKEEFEIMKTNSVIGADMLKNIPLHTDEPLVKVAYEICRWHHERYDGSGYPDGLKGEAIPISAQAVSIADAYDALISERVYKKAYSHEKAMRMILDGECGAFHPLLLECLTDIADQIQEELKINSLGRIGEKEFDNIVEQLLSQKIDGGWSADTEGYYLLRFMVIQWKAAVQRRDRKNQRSLSEREGTVQRTLEKLYEEIGGDYQSMAARMRKEERIEKFVRLFLKDNSYRMILQSMENKNVEEAFRAAHTLKGVCMNLSFDALYQIAGELTEELRQTNMEKAAELLPDLKKCYEKHIQAIRAYTKELNSREE